jgi:serine/threonine protein kinase
MYIFGGIGANAFLNDIFCFNITTLKWKKLDPRGLTPPPCAYHSVVVHNDHLVFFGGMDNGRILNLTFMLNTKSMEWIYPTIHGSPPQPRAAHGAVIVGKQMLIHGGYNGVTYFADLWALDLRTYSWCEPVVKGIAPSTRAGHSTVISESEIFVFGGVSENAYLGDTFLLDTLEEDMDGNEDAQDEVPNRDGYDDAAVQVDILTGSDARSTKAPMQTSESQTRLQDLNGLLPVASGDNPAAAYPPLEVVSSVDRMESLTRLLEQQTEMRQPFLTLASVRPVANELVIETKAVTAFRSRAKMTGQDIKVQDLSKHYRDYVSLSRRIQEACYNDVPLDRSETLLAQRDKANLAQKNAFDAVLKNCSTLASMQTDRISRLEELEFLVGSTVETFESEKTKIRTVAAPSTPTSIISELDGISSTSQAYQAWLGDVGSKVASAMLQTNDKVRELEAALHDEQELLEQCAAVIGDGFTSSHGVVSGARGLLQEIHREDMPGCRAHTAALGRFYDRLLQRVSTQGEQKSTLEKLKADFSTLLSRKKDLQLRYLDLTFRLDKVNMEEASTKEARARAAKSCQECAANFQTVAEEIERHAAQLQSLAQSDFPELLVDPDVSLKSLSRLVLSERKLADYVQEQILAYSGHDIVAASYFGRPAVLKKFRMLDERAFADLSEQMEHLRGWKHPLILPPRSIFRDGLFAYVEFEPSPLGSLASWYQRQHFLPSDLPPIIRQLLQGLAFLHRQGVAHGHLTPHGVLLFPATESSEADGTVIPKLCGLGTNIDKCPVSADEMSLIAPEVRRSIATGTYAPTKRNGSQLSAHMPADCWGVGICLLMGLCPNYSIPIPADTVAVLEMPELEFQAFLPLLKQMLQIDPLRRPTASALLQHDLLWSQSSMMVLSPSAVARQDSLQSLSLWDERLSHLYRHVSTLRQANASEQGQLLKLEAPPPTGEVLTAVLHGFKQMGPGHLFRPWEVVPSPGDLTATLPRPDPLQLGWETSTLFGPGSSLFECCEGVDESWPVQWLPRGGECVLVDELRCVGKMLAKCVLEGRPWPLELGSVFCTLLAGEKPSLSDLERFDPQTALLCHRLNAAPGASALELTFEGVKVEKSTTPVTDQNKTDFIACAIGSIEGEKRSEAMKAIREGFFSLSWKGGFPTRARGFDWLLLAGGLEYLSPLHLYALCVFVDINPVTSLIPSLLKSALCRLQPWELRRLVMALLGVHGLPASGTGSDGVQWKITVRSIRFDEKKSGNPLERVRFHSLPPQMDCMQDAFQSSDDLLESLQAHTAQS